MKTTGVAFLRGRELKSLRRTFLIDGRCVDTIVLYIPTYQKVISRLPAFSSLNAGMGYRSILRWNRGGGSRLDYEAIWKLMADLVAALRRSGESVPSDVMKDLRSAKTMMEIHKVDQSRPEHLLRIEEYLNSVESYLMPVAKRKFGEEYVDQWMKRILEAQKTVQAGEKKLSRRFPVGIPRDKLWVRMEPSTELPRGEIEQSAEEEGLDFRIEKDGYVLVYGEEKSLKRFVRKIASLLRQKQGLSPNIVKKVYRRDSALR